jgi:septum formation protein
MLLNKLKNYDVILASGSPRRQQLLTEMDISFRIQTREVEETFPDNLTPEAAVTFLCRMKSLAFREDELNENTLLISADTLVVLNDKILGKPAGEKEAVEMLRQLSGKKHKVITGVCLRLRKRMKTFTVSSSVYFKVLSEDEINYYTKNYKPMDKAGAYGIQEWIGHAAIQKIEGSYFNIMGLPTHRLYEELNGFLL